MSDELKPEDRALIEAAEDLLTAYRERYAKRSTDGVRTNAPLRREMGTLKIALDAARAQGPGEAVAWRVKDFADGWTLYANKDAADVASLASSGALVEALGVIAATPTKETPDHEQS